jgi:hypothetical protein
MKAGWWRQLEILDGGRPVDHAYCDGGRDLTPARDGDCAVFGFRRTAAGDLIFRGECVSPTDSSTTLAIIKGDPNRAFSEDTVLLIKQSGERDIHIVGHLEFTYLGACPPGARIYLPDRSVR